jgi:hypothetical protein
VGPFAIVLASIGVAIGLIQFYIVGRWLFGRPVGPGRAFGRALRPRPFVVPGPPSPARNRWRPWFLLWGPAWLDLKQGLATENDFWAMHFHQSLAYHFYLLDRLPECVAALEKALECGTRPEQWSARLFAMASAEQVAHEDARVVRAAPFTFELPADEPAFQSLVGVGESVRAHTERLLGFEPGPTLVTVLPEESLPRPVGSRWGYLADKTPYAKICLLRPAGDGVAEASEGLVSEYVRLALYETTQGRAPRWLIEGLIAVSLGRVLGKETPGEPPGVPRRRLSERALQAAVRCSPLQGLALRPTMDSAIVERLLGECGNEALGAFARGLATLDEGCAFREAFGESEKAFVRRAFGAATPMHGLP